jgi:CheY-like chemotaxis protein
MTKKPVILIVDDEPDLREAIAFDFQRNNFRVLTAGGGKEAFGLIESNQVDIVLSDMRMPNGDGLELLERVKARNPFQPVVILITGFADISLEEAFAKGADAVFSKPFDRALLMRAVLSALQPADHKMHRRSSRVEVDLEAELTVKGKSIPAKIVNIGRDGVFVEIGERIPEVSDEIDFSFEASFWGPKLKMAGRGVVRWVRDGSAPSSSAGCGIEFTQLTPGSSRNMVNLINFTKTNSCDLAEY